MSASVAGQELNVNLKVVNMETAMKKPVKEVFGNKHLKLISHAVFF